MQEAPEQWLELPEHAVHAVAPWREQTAAAEHAEQQASGAGFEGPVTALHASGTPVMLHTAAAWEVSSDWQLVDDSAAASQLQPELVAEVEDLLVELRA